MSDPENLRYTESHEWVRQDGLKVVFGITDFAQRNLGSVVHVDLPSVGTTVVAGEPCAEIESTKSVSEIFAPASGTVTEVNEAVGGSPELVNDDPYGDGWLVAIDIIEDAAFEPLLSAAEYADLQSTLADDH
ncbi:MAG TPA: glycine cleavage system protein GcvH [Acidimicrobiales bacterium]|nr:glycine cleavage system protein GcvH [Acidimicrobiales bacterium]